MIHVELRNLIRKFACVLIAWWVVSASAQSVDASVSGQNESSSYSGSSLNAEINQSSTSASMPGRTAERALMNEVVESGSALGKSTRGTGQSGSRGAISRSKAAYVLRGINRYDLAWKQNFMRAEGVARNLRTARSNALQPGVANPYPVEEMKDVVNAEAFGAEQSKPVNGQVQAVVSYTTDFPDSTRGTALLSPPDTGTLSPLEWSPDHDFAFPDFSGSTFLNPTLHVSQRSSKKKRRERGRNDENLAPFNHGAPVLPSLSQPDLEPDILKEPVVQSPLDSVLNPQYPQ